MTEMSTLPEVERFEDFHARVEPRLRRALVARFGIEEGREAAADALGWAFEHWEKVQTFENPSGYLYRVGCSRARRGKRRVLFEAAAPGRDSAVEPALAGALTRLSPKQRTAVVLVKGYGWELHEVAELTGSSISTVNTHVRRGLAKLRDELGVEP
jgi:RNA polymerase sigma-70 factor (ECF subfamily)